MKGQFFVVATVIMIITLMSLVRYFYGFSAIDLPSIKEISELNYIPFIRESLGSVVDASGEDCAKLQTDLDSAIEFIEDRMISRGVKTIITYNIYDCPSDTRVDFYFNMTPGIFTETYFSTAQTCPDGICEVGERCPADWPDCADRKCYEPTCLDGCGERFVYAGLTDEACHDNTGCGGTDCLCNGFGVCITGSTPPPPPT